MTYYKFRNRYLFLPILILSILIAPNSFAADTSPEPEQALESGDPDQEEHTGTVNAACCDNIYKTCTGGCDALYSSSQEKLDSMQEVIEVAKYMCQNNLITSHASQSDGPTGSDESCIEKYKPIIEEALDLHKEKQKHTKCMADCSFARFDCKNDNDPKKNPCLE